MVRFIFFIIRSSFASRIFSSCTEFSNAFIPRHRRSLHFLFVVLFTLLLSLFIKLFSIYFASNEIVSDNDGCSKLLNHLNHLNHLIQWDPALNPISLPIIAFPLFAYFGDLRMILWLVFVRFRYHQFPVNSNHFEFFLWQDSCYRKRKSHLIREFFGCANKPGNYPKSIFSSLVSLSPCCMLRYPKARVLPNHFSWIIYRRKLLWCGWLCALCCSFVLFFPKIECDH